MTDKKGARLDKAMRAAERSKMHLFLVEGIDGHCFITFAESAEQASDHIEARTGQEGVHVARVKYWQLQLPGRWKETIKSYGDQCEAAQQTEHEES